MGTTLTGTTPQDTYDSLIKVTDNGPLSGSLKRLTDGLGNDSALSLSTGGASVTGTLAVSSTSTLSTTLVAGASTAGFITPLTVRNPSTNAASSVKIGLDAGNTIWGEIGASYNSNDPYMAFFVRSGSEKVRITDAGNVGVGLTNPSQRLEVQNAAAGAAIRASNSGGGYAQLAVSSNATSVAELSFTNSLSLTGGNVGIGTSSPVGFAADDTVLQVNCPTASPAAARSILRLTNSYTGTTWGNGSALVVDNNVNLAIVNYEPSSYINFLTNDGSTIAERMRITSAGNVGIGTTSPSSTFKLTVNSGSNVNSFLNGDKISFSRTSDNATDVAYLSRTNDLGVNGTANIHGYDGIQFRTQGPESVKATITSAGNVGIGKTSPSNALHIGKAAVSILLDGLKVDRDPSTSTSSIFNAFGGATNIVSNSGVTSSFTSHIVFGLSDNTTTTEIARITSNGLTFNGDTAAANALDDYEEGTWTPTVIGATSGEATYIIRYGAYTKIGRQVTITFSVAFQKNTINGFVTLGGLPFTVGNTTGNLPQAAVLIDNLASAYNNPILQLSTNNTSGILLIDNGSTTAHGILPSTQLGAGTMDFRGTVTYFV